MGLCMAYILLALSQAWREEGRTKTQLIQIIGSFGEDSVRSAVTTLAKGGYIEKVSVVGKEFVYACTEKGLREATKIERQMDAIYNEGN